MKRTVKRVLLVIVAVVLVVALSCAIFAYVQVRKFDSSMAKVYDVPPMAITRSDDPAVIARGEHLSKSIAACSLKDCHGADFSGGRFIDMGPVGSFAAPNITNVLPAYSDGELARLKFQESRFGGVLDFWGDNVVHSAVFACIGIGWSREAGASFPLVLGALAVAGTLASAGFVYRTTMRRPKEGPLFTSVAEGGSAARVADALSRRDFIYLVILLSLFGRASWFLVLAAIGAPVFFLVLVALSRRGPERKTV